jgi:hypothetical protein
MVVARTAGADRRREHQRTDELARGVHGRVFSTLRVVRRERSLFSPAQSKLSGHGRRRPARAHDQLPPG